MADAPFTANGKQRPLFSGRFRPPVAPGTTTEAGVFTGGKAKIRSEMRFSVLFDAVKLIRVIDRPGSNSMQFVAEISQQLATGSVNILAMRGKKNNRT